jgi:hypothetical protein
LEKTDELQLSPSLGHIVTRKNSPSHAWLSRVAQVERLEVGIMKPRRSATVAAVLCGTGVAWFAVFGSYSIENTAAPTLDGLAPFLTGDAPQPTEMGNTGIGNVDVARAAELVRGTATDTTAASDKLKSVVEAALTNSSDLLPPETPPVQVATASTPNAVPEDTKDTGSSIEILDECLVGDICIDRYLWALYQRTPKEDTIKVQRQDHRSVRTPPHFWSAGAGERSAEAERIHSLDVPSHGNEAPLAANAVEPAQQKLAESHHRFDDAEHWIPELRRP